MYWALTVETFILTLSLQNDIGCTQNEVTYCMLLSKAMLAIPGSPTSSTDRHNSQFAGVWTLLHSLALGTEPSNQMLEWGSIIQLGHEIVTCSQSAHWSFHLITFSPPHGQSRKQNGVHCHSVGNTFGLLRRKTFPWFSITPTDLYHDCCSVLLARIVDLCARDCDLFAAFLCGNKPKEDCGQSYFHSEAPLMEFNPIQKMTVRPGIATEFTVFFHCIILEWIEITAIKNPSNRVVVELIWRLDLRAAQLSPN